MTRDPTPAQRRVLDAIVRMQKKDGYSPSIRELAAALGVASTNTVVCHLRALEAHGLIRRPLGKRRVIEVLAPSETP